MESCGVFLGHDAEEVGDPVRVEPGLLPEGLHRQTGAGPAAAAAA
eukprot:CAMPEP_0194590902 /NCGR_PEP_ID=MMETSP0292-20121207/21690_1 /TAXON_ID=39354 /ORGANISM="Heterosigma akashiwo, Strain CCMP2393" /LENGTH=44 /DNA_ID= /DNA_START= /DNA_END= /DNA_ORIENTATION=